MVPLYAYSVPSHCKTLMDRILCFNQPESKLNLWLSLDNEM